MVAQAFFFLILVHTITGNRRARGIAPKDLAGLLSPLLGRSSRHIMNCIEFVHTLGSFWVRPKNLVISFDVVSLITWVSLLEYLNPCSQHFIEDILTLFRHVLYILLHWWPILQVDRVTMGSLLSPVITNFFMAGEGLSTSYPQTAVQVPLCWWHFCHLAARDKLERFLNHLNGLHGNKTFHHGKTDREPPTLSWHQYIQETGWLHGP